jgi:hypothetical protein
MPSDDSPDRPSDHLFSDWKEAVENLDDDDYESLLLLFTESEDNGDSFHKYPDHPTDDSEERLNRTVQMLASALIGDAVGHDMAPEEMMSTFQNAVDHQLRVMRDSSGLYYDSGAWHFEADGMNINASEIRQLAEELREQDE